MKGAGHEHLIESKNRMAGEVCRNMEELEPYSLKNSPTDFVSLPTAAAVKHGFGGKGVTVGRRRGKGRTSPVEVSCSISPQVIQKEGERMTLAQLYRDM